MESIELIAIGITAILGLFGFKKSNRKYSGVVEIVQRVNILILSITEAIQPDNDGNVRISTDELDRIREELKQTRKIPL